MEASSDWLINHFLLAVFLGFVKAFHEEAENLIKSGESDFLLLDHIVKNDQDNDSVFLLRLDLVELGDI